MFEKDISLARHSHYKIGGPALYFYEPKSVEELIAAVEKAKERRMTVFIVGGGTNLLIADEGYNGLALKPAFNWIKRDGQTLTVGAGVTIARLLDFTVTKRLSGLEWSGGLPGFLGGAVRGNAGAFKGEIKDSVLQVLSLDISGPKPKIVRRNGRQCRFGYRDSIFKQLNGREVIVEAVLWLNPGERAVIRQAIEEKIKWRAERQPLDYPNIGSIFKNVDWSLVPPALKTKENIRKHIKIDPLPVLPAACLIDQAGLKGVTLGGAMISAKHPNFIVNALGATAADVGQLIGLIKAVIRDKFTVALEEEIEYSPHPSSPLPAAGYFSERCQ